MKLMGSQVSVFAVADPWTVCELEACLRKWDGETSGY